MNTEKVMRILGEIKPIVLMVLSQIGSGGVNVFYKLATADGMSVRVIVTYRLLFATAFMVPLAFLLERNSRPKLTWMIAFLGFLSGFFGGALGNNLFAESLVLTSATFSTAISNLMPATTFIMAIIFRLEKLAIGTLAGKAKLFGTALGIGGAMVLTLYKGLEIKIIPTHTNFLHHHDDVAASQRGMANPLLGSIIGIAGCFSVSTWLVIQTRISERYPSYSSTALMCFMGSIQAFVFATCTEKDWSAWKLGWNIRLLTVAYAGIVSSGLVNAATSWVAWTRGPLFVSSFYPLGLIFVAFVGSLFLEEKLHLGSLIGSVLIIGGLYAVLWGKRMEVELRESTTTTTTSNNNNNNNVTPTSIDRAIEDA